MKKTENETQFEQLQKCDFAPEYQELFDLIFDLTGKPLIDSELEEIIETVNIIKK